MDSWLLKTFSSSSTVHPAKKGANSRRLDPQEMLLRGADRRLLDVLSAKGLVLGGCIFGDLLSRGLPTMIWPHMLNQAWLCVHLAPPARPN